MKTTRSRLAVSCFVYVSVCVSVDPLLLVTSYHRRAANRNKHMAQWGGLHKRAEAKTTLIVVVA